MMNTPDELDQDVKKIAEHVQRSFSPPLSDFEARTLHSNMQGGVVVVGCLRDDDETGFDAHLVMATAGMTPKIARELLVLIEAEEAKGLVVQIDGNDINMVKRQRQPVLRRSRSDQADICAAYDRSRLDISPCSACSLPMIVIPDGMPGVCTDCEKAGKRP